MGFWAAAALGGGSLLSGIGSIVAGNEAADAASDAARENNQTQRYMFDQSVALNEPWRQAGIGALNQQNALLGISGSSGGTTSTGGAIGANDYGSYVNSRPDLANAFNALSTSDQRGISSLGYDRNNDGNISAEEYGAFHYDTHGRAGGATMPTFSAPTAAETAQAGNDAYSDFENSGFARSMLNTTQSDFDMIRDASGAGGTALSGQYLEALNDANRGNTSTAFNNYYNALAGQSGTGAQLSQSQGAQGMQLANSLSANNTAAANAQGSSYMNAANAFSNTLQNGANTYMYGREQGWWGS